MEQELEVNAISLNKDKIQQLNIGKHRANKNPNHRILFENKETSNHVKIIKTLH